MASGLNSRNPMVNILDDEHFEAKQVRFDFVRHCVITGIINAIVCTIAFILLGSYIRAGVHFLFIVITFFLLIRNTVRRLNLRKISGIIFDNAEYINYANVEEVFNATRLICEMKGIAKGRRDIANIIHIASILSLVVEIVNVLIGG